MYLFVAMAAIATFLAARSGLRLLRSRFLQPGDLAIISTFYYTVPLAVCGFFMYNPRSVIFLHRQAADPAIAMQSMQYGLAAILAILAGGRLGALFGPPRLATYFRLDEVGETRARLAFVGLIALVGLGILQFGYAQFLAGYATESDQEGATLGLALVYFAVGSFGLVIVYALLLHRFRQRRSLLLLIGLAILCAMAVLLIRAKRLEIVTTLLPAAILLLAQRGAIKVATSRFVLGGLAVGGLVAVSVIRIGDQFDLFNLNFYLLAEGLYAGHSLPGVIARFNSGMLDHENGARFLNAILGFVPRFFWPGKDDIVYAGNLALEDVSPLGATSILSEIVLQGGMVAVVICYSIMGYLFERASRFEAVWDRAIATGAIPGRFIAYLVLTSIFVPHFRDGIIPAVKLTLQAGVFMMVLVHLQRLPAWLAAPRAASGTPAPATRALEA